MKNKKEVFKRIRRIGFVTMFFASILSCNKEVFDGQKKIEQSEGVVFHDFIINGNKTTIKQENDVYYFSEDVILSERQFNYLKRLNNQNISTEERSTIITDFVLRWPNGTVFYDLSGIQNQNKRNTILNAIQHIQTSVASINFIARTTQTNYVTFRDWTSNSSQLGMIGGQQFINLFDNHFGITVHEILHALGVHHEQCRPDRNNFVTVHWANVIPGFEINFNVAPNVIGHGTFDFGSIMLYSSGDFSINGQPTITRLDGSQFTGQRNNLSSGDINGLEAIYPAINGVQSICSSSQYNLGEVINGSTFSWTANPSGRVSISNATSASPTVSKVGNGPVTLTAQVSRTGQNFVVSRNIHVGAPIDFGGTFISPGPGNPGVLGQFNCLKRIGYGGPFGTYYNETLDISVDDPTASVTWEVIEKASPNTWVNLNTNSGKTNIINVAPQGHHVVIRITISNSCGSYSRDHYFIADGTCNY